MHRAFIGLAALLAAAGPAAAAVEVHSFDYAYALATDGDNYPRLTLPGFDDANGTRVLSRVDVRLESTVSATLAIENMTNAPLSGWTLDGQHNVLTSFERQNPETFGPFAFLGGLNFEPFTATLQAKDGLAGSGPDSLIVSDSVTANSFLEMEASYLPFFNDGGEIRVVLGPFTEFVLQDAAMYDESMEVGDATVRFTDLAQAGTFSVIYNYSVVPEPSSMLAAAAGASLTRRRRRGA